MESFLFLAASHYFDHLISTLRYIFMNRLLLCMLNGSSVIHDKLVIKYHNVRMTDGAEGGAT